MLLFGVLKYNSLLGVFWIRYFNMFFIWFDMLINITMRNLSSAQTAILLIPTPPFYHLEHICRRFVNHRLKLPSLSSTSLLEAINLGSVWCFCSICPTALWPVPSLSKWTARGTVSRQPSKISHLWPNTIFMFNRDRIRRIITTIKQRLQVRLGIGYNRLRGSS